MLQSETIECWTEVNAKQTYIFQLPNKWIIKKSTITSEPMKNINLF